MFLEGILTANAMSTRMQRFMSGDWLQLIDDAKASWPLGRRSSVSGPSADNEEEDQRKLDDSEEKTGENGIDNTSAMPLLRPLDWMSKGKSH